MIENLIYSISLSMNVDYGNYDVILLENPENWWWTDIMKILEKNLEKTK